MAKSERTELAGDGSDETAPRQRFFKKPMISHLQGGWSPHDERRLTVLRAAVCCGTDRIRSKWQSQSAARCPADTSSRAARKTSAASRGQCRESAPAGQREP